MDETTEKGILLSKSEYFFTISKPVGQGCWRHVIDANGDLNVYWIPKEVTNG